MKKLTAIMALVMTSALLGACKPTATGEASIAAGAPQSDKDKYSYGFGYNIATSLAGNGIEVDTSFFNAGVHDALNGQEARMTQDEIRDVINALQQRLAQEQADARIQQAKDNRAQGEAFLAENASVEGVVTTDSGLQYQVVSAGEGNKPAASDTVEVHYEGRLIDGTVFDSSYQRGAPARFPVRGVIAGWTEALQLMPVGSKWKLFIPSDLAYGPNGAGEQIGPHATLVFDVELLSIEGQEGDAGSVEDAASDAGEAAGDAA